MISKINSYLKLIFIIVIVVKLLILPFSAHPFDFWAFTNQLQRHFLYGWDLFEYWNKGNLLLLIWYPFYYFYETIIHLFSINGDNLYLLHFFLKLPFLFIDILCAFLIYKIVLSIYSNQDFAKFASILWFLNPIIFYIYGIHGHYELLTIFGIILLLYGLVNEHIVLISLGFVISFTTKYFSIIFLPFILLFIFKNYGYKKMISLLFLLSLFIFLSFFHLFLNNDLLIQTINSIIHLSQPNGPEGINIIDLQPINIFSGFNFLLGNTTPINTVNNHTLFIISSKGLFISAFLLIVFFLYQIFLVCIKKQQYNFFGVFRSIFISFLFFLLFLGNFQPHYIGWLIPFLIIFSFTNLLYFNILIIISLIGFIYTFRGEFGTRTFFMDIYGENFINGLTSKDYQHIYLEGSIIIFIIIILIIVSFVKIKKSIFKINIIHIGLIIIPWLLILIAFQSISHIENKENYNKLAYARYGNYSRGIIYGEHSIKKISGNKLYFQNISDGGAILIKTINSLSRENKNKFNAYILYKDNNLNIQGNFNDCSLNDSQIIYSQYTNDYFNGYKIDINCIKEEDNYIEIWDMENINVVKDFKLYISNQNIPF